jgi:DNA-binding MurR/RpiR family transcriptional regulator
MNSRSISFLPRDLHQKMRDMAETDGVSWPTALRMVLEIGLRGVEELGGFKAVRDEIEATKDRMLRDAALRHKTAA